MQNCDQEGDKFDAWEYTSQGYPLMYQISVEKPLISLIFCYLFSHVAIIS